MQYLYTKYVFILRKTLLWQTPIGLKGSHYALDIIPRPSGSAVVCSPSYKMSKCEHPQHKVLVAPLSKTGLVIDGSADKTGSRIR